MHLVNIKLGKQVNRVLWQLPNKRKRFKEIYLLKLTIKDIYFLNKSVKSSLC